MLQYFAAVKITGLNSTGLYVCTVIVLLTECIVERVNCTAVFCGIYVY